MDVGQDASIGNGDCPQELAELLIIADGELDVTGYDTVLLVVTSCVASQLQHLCRNVLEDSCQVDWGTSTDPLGVLALLQVAGNTAHWELQASLGAARDGLLATATAPADAALGAIERKILKENPSEENECTWPDRQLKPTNQLVC